jgi:hypothetical protein
MKRLRHLVRLLAELAGFARENKAWWIVPLVLLLMLLSLLIAVSASVPPFVYALF